MRGVQTLCIIATCVAFLFSATPAPAASPPCGEDTKGAIAAAREALEALKANTNSNEHVRMALVCLLYAVDLSQNQIEELKANKGTFQELHLKKVEAPRPESAR